jgi:predicted PurR-regulated permease PerM
MTNPTQPTEQESQLKKLIQLILQLGVLFLIFGWCFMMLAPFLSPILWGMIIAITAYPMFAALRAKLGNRGKMASILVTVLFLSIVIVPSILLAESLVEGIQHFRETLQEGKSLIPPPGDQVKNWPSFTKPVIDIWQSASENLQGVAVKYKDQLVSGGKYVLALIGKTGIGILQFVVSIILAGIFLAYSKEGETMLRSIFVKLAGDKGHELAAVSEGTIRSVVKGILGVALVQTFMAGLGFFIAGVPAAGLWTFFCLIFAIIQLGVGPILIPVIIYVFNTADTTTAVIFLIWGIIVMISDNILKPILLGRGAPVPMLVVFLGSIGGFIASGFIGLFLGAVIMSLGYKLFLTWISKENGEEKSESKIENEST